MNIILKTKPESYHVVSLAKDEKTANDLSENGLDFLLAENNTVKLFPDNLLLVSDKIAYSKLISCSNYDVFELYPDGFLTRVCDCNSCENVFFVTGACNSNCIMCPSPLKMRINAKPVDIDNLISIAKHMPADINHITVTGGEPFMAGKDIFRLFDYCGTKFEETEFQILTNGRIFALKEYCSLLQETLPVNSIIGIPLHGSIAEIHDAVTQAPGSFIQTVTGIRNLLSLGFRVEIRIVVSRLNIYNLDALAALITKLFQQTDHVSIMALEMTGNAFANEKSVWIEYRESFRYVKPAILTLIKSGIDTVLYNFPLCTVDQEFHTICAKSISTEKVRFGAHCLECSKRDACGGVFSGTFRLEKDYLKSL